MNEHSGLLDLLEQLKKSEEKYRQLIEQASDAIYVLSHEGNFTDVNQSMCNMTGYTREELLQMSITQLVDPEQLKIDPLKYVPPSAPETSMVRERRFRRKCGEVFDVEINVKTFPNDRVMVIARNITSRKLMEAQLKLERDLLFHSEAHLQTILNNTDTAYILLDTSLDIIKCNDLARNFLRAEFGYDAAAGSNLVSKMPQEQIGTFNDYVAMVLNGEPVSYEVYHQSSQGDNLWYHVRMFPIANGEKHILGLVMAATDITGHKRSEHHLRLAYDHIQAHVESIKDMAWKQSHLIRSPLANLKGLVDILKTDPADGTTLQYICFELDRLDKVILEMSAQASV